MISLLTTRYVLPIWEIFQLNICEIEKVLHWLISLAYHNVRRQNKTIIYINVSMWTHVVGILRGKACASASRLLLPRIGWKCGAKLFKGQLLTAAMQRHRFCLFVTKRKKQISKRHFNLKNLTTIFFLVRHRPSAREILKHPFFWNREKQLAFFQVRVRRLSGFVNNS